MKQILSLLLCALLLTGCGQNHTTPTDYPAETTQETIPLQTPAETPAEAPAESPSEAPTEPQLSSLLVYYGDDSAEKILCKEIQVAQISETEVVSQLIAAGVLRDGIAVNSLELSGTQLTLDFNQAFADLVCSMGTSGEYIIVGSTVNTFLKAYNAETLIFTVNGSTLESGHVIYDFPLEFTP